LVGQRIHDATAQFSRWRWVEISLGIAALARPDKIYAVGKVPAARSWWSCPVGDRMCQRWV